VPWLPEAMPEKATTTWKTTAKNLLLAGMQRQAKLRRITGDQIGVVALCEAVERRKQAR
jgi:hypothetical protein